MNIIDSIGVMLGGDSKPFDTMMDKAESRLDNFDKKMSAWAGKMSLYVSAPLLAMGTRNVFLFAEQEKAILGLQAQLGKVSARPFVDFSNELQDSLGKDNDAMIQLMSRFAAMGTAAKDLKKTTVNAIGLSAATGMGEFQAYRAMEMLKKGSTTMFARYIPGLSQMDQSQQVAKVVELINRGLTKTRAESMGVAGSFRAMKMAMDDVAKSSGEMLAEHLKLPELFRRVVGFAKQVEESLRKLTPTTKSWVAWLGGGLALLGPIAMAFAKIVTTMRALNASLAMFARTMLVQVLPAVLVVAGVLATAFLAFEIGKTLNEYQVGMFKIGQWTELVVTSMIEKWEQYFAFIKSGITAASANDELAAAYGMQPNKMKQGLAKMLPAGMIQTYDDITETRSQKQQRLDLVRQPLQLKYDMAKSWYDADPSNEDSARNLERAEIALMANPEIRNLTKEIEAMRGTASEATVAALEKKFTTARSGFTNYDSQEGARIAEKWQTAMNERMAEFQQENTETPGITSFAGFMEALKKNIGGDLESGMSGLTGGFKTFFAKWFKEFKPTELKSDGVADAFSMAGQPGAKSFAAALEEGTQEAYSAIYGNVSQQDRSLKAQEKTVDLLGSILQAVRSEGGSGLSFNDNVMLGGV